MHRYGPPGVLEYETVPDPEPRAGEIRICVHAATVNRVLDVSLRAGNERARGAILPLIPGVDCAGVVDAVGSTVTRWRKGMRVAAAGVMPLDICPEDGAGYEGPTGMMGIKRPGGFAEMVAVPACTAIELPDGLDFHHAAVIMRHVPTAWNLLVNVAELKAGESVLIMGAGGNLGSIGIQIAKNVIGANVIAAAGSDARVAIGLALGADHGVNYNVTDLQAEIMRLTGRKGVDVLYDNIANPKVLPSASARSVSTAGWSPPARMGGPAPRSISPTSITSASPSRGGRAIGHPTCRNALPPPPKARSRRRSSAFCRCRAPPRRIDWSNRATRRARSCSTRRGDRPRSFMLSLSPHCAAGGRMPIFRLLPSSPMTPSFARQGGRSTEEISHGSRTADAESDRRLAGREHRARLRSGRRLLQAAPARGEGDR
jgi:NADPH:quinone reductase-like Zn-dependent oxidoreductase